MSHQLVLPQVWPQPVGPGSSPGVHTVPDVEALPLLLEEPDIVDDCFVYLLSPPLLSPQPVLNKILIK